MFFSNFQEELEHLVSLDVDGDEDGYNEKKNEKYDDDRDDENNKVNLIDSLRLALNLLDKQVGSVELSEIKLVKPI